MSTDPWRFALAAWTPVTERQRHLYATDPVAFAHDCIDWPPGQEPAAYQDEIWAALAEHARVAVRGPRGLGKTTIEAIGLLWFAITRDGEDWKAPTTASSWQQLIHYLWPEVHKWARRLRFDRLERRPLNLRTELLTVNLKLATGEAFAASPSEASLIEGAHADCLAYFYDEAKLISAAIFDAVEGAFAGAGPDTSAEAFALAASIPGEPQGRFYEIHSRHPGLEDWWVRHVTLDEAIAAGRISAHWVKQRRRHWTESSALFQNHVLGEFASADADGVIPLAWVEAAVARWRERYGANGENWDAPGPLEAYGVDVSDTGGDQTVFAPRYGDIVGPLERGVRVQAREPGEAVLATAGRIVAVLQAEASARAVVDAIGVGAGTVAAARAQLRRTRVVAFVASHKTTRRDRSGSVRFADKRSAAWWGLRDALDPVQGDDVCLPPDDLMIGDLVAPHWFEQADGRIRVESKQDIAKRIGRSTDSGDAVVQSFWEESAAGSTTITTGSIPRLDPRRSPRATPAMGRRR